jgi:hypothetical protein
MCFTKKLHFDPKTVKVHFTHNIVMSLKSKEILESCMKSGTSTNASKDLINFRSKMLWF